MNPQVTKVPVQLNSLISIVSCNREFYSTSRHVYCTDTINLTLYPSTHASNLKSVPKIVNMINRNFTTQHCIDPEFLQILLLALYNNMLN